MLEPSYAHYRIQQDDRVWKFSTNLVGAYDDLEATIHEENRPGYEEGYGNVFTYDNLKECSQKQNLRSPLEFQYIIDDCIESSKVTVNDLHTVVDVVFDLSTERGGRNKAVFRLPWRGRNPPPCCREGEPHNPDRIQVLEEDTGKIADEQRQMREKINRLLYNREVEKPYPEDEEEIFNNKNKNKTSPKIFLNLSGVPPSSILKTPEELEMLSKKINKYNSANPSVKLLYKASKDGDQSSVFHSKCDNKGPTLILIESIDGRRFGGYTTQSWAGNKVEKEDESAFVFSLDKKMVYDVEEGCAAIGCYPKFGPVFMGCQIKIYNNAFQKPGTTYEAGVNYNTREDYELTGGKREFYIQEIEVYEIQM